MNISNSFSSPLTSGVSNNSKAIAPIKNSVRSAEPVAEIEQDQSSNKQATPSIVIDEQAIALFEQNQASIESQTSKESFSSDNQDQPSAKNETAVASYQAVGNLAQRESVQKLFGVDLFA